MSAPKPYVPKQGDLVCRRFRGSPEYLFIHNGNGTHTPFTDLRQWSRLGGRWVCEIACSNPRDPRPVPEAILCVNHFGKEKQMVVARKPFPAVFKELWNCASVAELHFMVRDYCRSAYDMSHTEPLQSHAKLDALVRRRLTIPRGQPFPTDI